MAANILNDLSEHAGSLVTLLGSLAVVCTVLVGAIYKLNSSMVDKIQKGLELHLAESRECQKELPLRFASKPDTDTAIATLFKRQNTLREETLPVVYMRKGDMDAWVVLNEKTFALFTSRLDIFSARIDKLIETLGRGKGERG